MTMHKMQASPRAPDINRLQLYARVGRAVHRARNAADLTLGELSARSGVPLQTISKVEGGDAPPPLHVLVAIAKVLGVTLNDIVPLE